MTCSSIFGIDLWGDRGTLAERSYLGARDTAIDAARHMRSKAVRRLVAGAAWRSGGKGGLHVPVAPPPCGESRGEHRTPRKRQLTRRGRGHDA